jgi:methionyl aminopeptidase
MIIGKSRKEIEKMRAAGRLAALVREETRRIVQVGITTREIELFAERLIRDAGAVPTFKGYQKYPHSICASINDEVVHGFPSARKLKNGDLLSIDFGVTLNGYVADTATTVPVGEVRADWLQLLRVAEECLALGIAQCYPGKYTGDIGWAIQQHAEKYGYGIVREWGGHGVGRKLHEDPHVPNYGKPGTGKKLKAGYTIAVEPMLNLGTEHVKTLADGWTIVTMDGQPSVHVEHTVAITETGPEILTELAPRADEKREREMAVA